jgi:hypothetical protein
VLHLKVGAQVMFIRNDSEAGAYYNGKLATVKEIHGTLIMVTFGVLHGRERPRRLESSR